MHLLYLDDSGSSGNKDEAYFVLGGLSVYEAQANYFTMELDKLAESIDPRSPNDIEFHASEIFTRKVHPWKGMTVDDARGVIKSVLQILSDSYDSANAFACAVHKDSYVGQNVVELAFEDLTSRFDLYLERLRASGDRQRGLMLLDQCAHETPLQDLARDFRKLGTRYGGLHHIADVPVFVNSKASRLIQMADHVAYATFRRYNAQDAQYFEIISAKFHSVDSVVHGLSHKTLKNPGCMCVACLSRRVASSKSK